MKLSTVCAIYFLLIVVFAEGDFFGSQNEPTGLYGELYDLKNDRDLKNTKIAKSGRVDTKEFYEEFERLVKKGFSEKELAKYYQGDETCNFDYIAIRNVRAEQAPTAFGSSYIDPKAIIILYEGTVEKAPNKEFRFAGYFDDIVAVLVNGELVFYSAWQDHNSLKSEEISNRRKKGRPVGDAYGKYIQLKKGDKLQIAFAEVPGGHILGTLKVQMSLHNYRDDSDDDPILHPFVAREVDRDLEKELKASGIPFELKRIPEFIFKIEE